MRLDDERGKEHIKVSTEYGGKSQLNLGHLVDAGKQQRGEGFELRTDLWARCGQRKASLSAPTRRTRRRVRCAKWLRRWQYWMAHSHR
ncbi:hypothetical protein DMI60_19615 [Escherichia coli]|nr:hypothetical protein [Escherichia coli]